MNPKKGADAGHVSISTLMLQSIYIINFLSSTGNFIIMEILKYNISINFLILEIVFNTSFGACSRE